MTRYAPISDGPSTVLAEVGGGRDRQAEAKGPRQRAQLRQGVGRPGREPRASYRSFATSTNAQASAPKPASDQHPATHTTRRERAPRAAPPVTRSSILERPWGGGGHIGEHRSAWIRLYLWSLPSSRGGRTYLVGGVCGRGWGAVFPGLWVVSRFRLYAVLVGHEWFLGNWLCLIARLTGRCLVLRGIRLRGVLRCCGGWGGVFGG